MRFSAAVHILRVNCAETARDRRRQPAHEIFSIRHKRRFQQPNFWTFDLLGSRSLP